MKCTPTLSRETQRDAQGAQRGSKRFRETLINSMTLPNSFLIDSERFREAERYSKRCSGSSERLKETQTPQRDSEQFSEQRNLRNSSSVTLLDSGSFSTHSERFREAARESKRQKDSES